MQIYRLSELKPAHQEFIIYSREPREVSKREKWRKVWRRTKKEGKKKGRKEGERSGRKKEAKGWG